MILDLVFWDIDEILAGSAPVEKARFQRSTGTNPACIDGKEDYGDIR